MATEPQKSRKNRALDFLQEQLKRGTKTKKKTMDEQISLTDKDKTRIEKEIKNLKTQV